MPSSSPVQAGWPFAARWGLVQALVALFPGVKKNYRTLFLCLWLTASLKRTDIKQSMCSRDISGHCFCFSGETLERRVRVGSLLIKARGIHASHWDIVVVVSYSINSWEWIELPSSVTALCLPGGRVCPSPCSAFPSSAFPTAGQGLGSCLRHRAALCPAHHFPLLETTPLQLILIDVGFLFIISCCNWFIQLFPSWFQLKPWLGWPASRCLERKCRMYLRVGLSNKICTLWSVFWEGRGRAEKKGRPKMILV